MERSDTVHQWYRCEIYRWRTGASIVWSVLTLPSIITLYLLAVTYSVINPVSSIYDFFVQWLSWEFFISLCGVMVVYSLLIIHNTQHFSVLPDIPGTRLQSFVSHFRGSKLIHALFTASGSAVMAWSLSGFMGGYYSSFCSPCVEDGALCLNEHHLVLILHALFTGLLHHYTFYSQQKNYIQFLPVHQPKLFHVKNKFTSTISDSFFNSLSSLKYFYLCYFVFGDIPKMWVARKLDLELRGLHGINSMYGVLDAQLFFYLLLAGTFLRLSWNMSHLLYILHNTEPFVFPIDTAHERYKNKCLHNALACDTAPLVQYLALLDLNILSVQDVRRRAELFTLSQPGGHAHNWNRVCAACVAEIDALSDTLQRHNWRSVTRRQTTADPAMTAASLNGAGGTTNKIGSPVPTVSDPVSHILQKVYDMLKNKPFICYLLSELPDAETRRLFASAQKQIWAIDALSNIVCASYKEDPYGIIQRSLPTILVSLLNLHENVEKFFKLTSTATRRSRDNQRGSHDANLRHSLRHMTKSGIYRIVDLFGKHLQEFPLSDEQLRKLRQFQEFRE